MLIRGLAIINKDQKGFTLIELLMVIAITSIITLGLVMTVFQLFGGHARSSGEMTAIRQVQNAGYHISRDAQMTQVVELGASSGFPLTLTWYQYCYHEDDPNDREGNGYRVIYTLDENGKLEREYYFAPEDSSGDAIFDPEPTYKTFIAEHIEVISCIYDGSKLYVTITASIESIAGKQEETRTYEAMPRPNVY